MKSAVVKSDVIYNWMYIQLCCTTSTNTLFTLCGHNDGIFERVTGGIGENLYVWVTCWCEGLIHNQRAKGRY